MPKEREGEAVDAGAAIAKGKDSSLVARPLLCRSTDAISADTPASNCGAIVEVEGAARAGEVDGRGDDDDDDDDTSNGPRDGATVRSIVSSVWMRIWESLCLASRL